MAPQTGTAILVLVVFVLPGFVALRYAEQTYRTRPEEGVLDRLLSALYFSLLTYAVIAVGSALLLDADTRDVRDLWRGRKPYKSYLALAGAGIVIPLIIAELSRRWNRSRLRRWIMRQADIDPAHRTPSGWEHFFLQGRWAYLRATLKDGRVVGGFYGPNSFAGYTAEKPDLYLEERYQLNGEDWFDGPAPGTLGLYIRADEIVSVEFYEAGTPPEKPSWWRRAWRRMRGDGRAPNSSLDPAPGPPDPETRRDLASRSVEDPSAAPSATEGRGELGAPERE